MLKNEKGWWTLFAGVLVLLFLMSSTDLILKEEKAEIFPISVVIDDVADNYYTSLKKGMEQAAKELNVDMNFITLYEKNNQKQQMELVGREISDGAKSVILIPVQAEESAKEIDGASVGAPLVIYGPAIPNEQVSASIQMDCEAGGKKLGQAVSRRHQKDVPVYFFTEGLEYGQADGIYQGLLGELEGYETFLIEGEGNDFREVIEQTVYPGDAAPVIIALDAASLDETCQILKDSKVYQRHVAGLYGAGVTTGFLNDMDQGIVTGLLMVNQYDAGYIGMKKAVEAAASGWKKEQITLDSYYIEKEDIRDKRYEKMLYPIG